MIAYEPVIQRSAVISGCGLYRYELTRSWRQGPLVTFLMLNPSTADAETDDPTIRRCMGFARSWGYSGISVVNLYAYRATDPAWLWTVADPVGPLNDATIKDRALRGPIVAAWGAKPKARKRARHVLEMIYGMGINGLVVRTIRRTKDGYPEHPLRLPANLLPRIWEDWERVLGGSRA